MTVGETITALAALDSDAELCVYWPLGEQEFYITDVENDDGPVVKVESR